jgi:hypothetical protein
MVIPMTPTLLAVQLLPGTPSLRNVRNTKSATFAATFEYKTIMEVSEARFTYNLEGVILVSRGS